MKIIAKDLGKQFQNEWIFKNLDFEFHTNKIYAVTGPNGSGKSTLLQVLAGFIPPTEGEVTYKKGDVFISPEHHYQHITVATPYTELIEEFTADELIKFHFKFKKILPGLELNKILPSINLAESIHKPISNFSSGMKQRLKLGLAFFSNTPIILLDEPTSNLDSQGIEWYQTLLEKGRENRLIIICSNQDYEYEQSDEKLAITDFKRKTVSKSS